MDDLHGIYEAERKVTGDIAPGGAYETARLTRGNRAVAEGALTMGVPKVQPDGSVRFEGKGLEQILSPVAGQMDDFLMYAVGRSAHELMRQGREQLFTKSEIAGMVALGDAGLSRGVLGVSDVQQWRSRFRPGQGAS